MEKKLSKDKKEEIANFSIEDYFGGSSAKTVNPDKQVQQTVTDRQTEEDVSENPVSPVQPTQPGIPGEQDNNIVSNKPGKKTLSAKQRKNSLTEYQETFLAIPKITDRRNVFVSNSTREMIVSVVRRFGGEKTSVSGFIENLVLHHFDVYGEDFEAWKKL